MTYSDFNDRTDSLIRALATCALARQDAKFDYFSNKLDQLWADYPEHRKTMDDLCRTSFAMGMENRNKAA